MNLNYQTIIHIFLFIFILHIIIINLPSKWTFSIGNSNKNMENFDASLPPVIDEQRKKFKKAVRQTNKDIEIQNYNKENTVNPVNTGCNKEERKKGLDFLTTNTNVDSDYEEFLRKNKSPVLPYNNYTDNDNIPNFESNVADISKFFVKNTNSANENKLCNSIQDNSVSQAKPKKIINYSSALNPISVTNSEKIQLVDNRGEFGRNSQTFPTTWTYNDEFAMNGGAMGGVMGNVTGFNTLESQFANFADLKLNLQQATHNNFNNVPHNDLRKPIVYN